MTTGSDSQGWKKSSYSQGNGNCVEVHKLANGSVAMRDSKSPDGPILEFTEGEWSAFLHGVSNKEFG